MKVFFAVDGSAGSFDAVAQVAKLLQDGRHEVALYCSPPSIRYARGTPDQSVVDRARKGLVDAVFEEAKLRLPEHLRAPVTTITSTDDPRQAIVAEAEKWGAGLIVVGARGLSALKRLLLGSVSRTVVHNSKVPVWVARTSEASVTHDGVNLLLACENPELGMLPAEFLQALAWPPGSKCHTLTVVPSMFAGKVPDWLEQQSRSPEVEGMVQAWAREHDTELSAMRARMREFCVKLPTVCQHGEPTVAEGEPAELILAAIKRENIDVVVLGHSRRDWFTSTLLGRTSEAVLNHAPCSVVIVPHKA